MKKNKIEAIINVMDTMLNIKKTIIVCDEPPKKTKDEIEKIKQLYIRKGYIVDVRLYGIDNDNISFGRSFKVPYIPAEKNEYATPFRHLEDYYVAIKPDGTIVRCYDNNVPENFAFIGHDHPHRNNYYDVFNKLKPEFWACERFYNDKDGVLTFTPQLP